jgi:hypothetical protein
MGFWSNLFGTSCENKNNEVKSGIELNKEYPVYDENNELTNMVAKVINIEFVEAPFDCIEKFQKQYVISVNDNGKEFERRIVVDCTIFSYKKKAYHLNLNVK